MQVEIDLKKVRQKLSEQAHLRGRQALANQAMADMNQFVPKRDGILRLTATVDMDGSHVNYNTPYARAQYYGRVGRGGYPVLRYSTPGTGPKWDEKAKPIYLPDWKKAYLKGAGY